MKASTLITAEDRERYIRKHYQKTLEELKKLLSYAQRSPEWFKAREGRITGSILYLIWKAVQLLTKMLWPEYYDLKNPIPPEYLDYGSRIEPGGFNIAFVALSQKLREMGYENVWLEETGTYIDPHRQYISVSSDGLIYATAPHLPMWRGTLEIKCPWTQRIYDKVPPKHYDQFMATANILGVPNAVYFVYTPAESQMMMYETDTVYWQERMLPVIDKFFHSMYIPAAIYKERGLLKEGEIELENIIYLTPSLTGNLTTTPVPKGCTGTRKLLKSTAPASLVKKRPHDLTKDDGMISLEHIIDHTKAPTKKDAREKTTAKRQRRKQGKTVKTTTHHSQVPSSQS